MEMSRWKKEQERKERAKQYQLSKQTAFHEAGHAVFATLKGPGVEIVTIDPERVHELTGQRCPGYTQYKQSGPAEADNVLGLTVAGLTAEALFVTDGVVSSQEDDLKRLNDLLENQMGLRGEAKDREMLRIRFLSQQFAAENRVAIRTVAKALMERRTLTGEEINQVLNR